MKWQRIYFKQVENDKMFATSLILCIQLYKNTRYSTHTKKVRPLPVLAVLLVSQNKIIRTISFFLVWGKPQVECNWFVHKKPTRNLHLSCCQGYLLKICFVTTRNQGNERKCTQIDYHAHYEVAKRNIVTDLMFLITMSV